jgi:hypothetical protein
MTYLCSMRYLLGFLAILWAQITIQSADLPSPNSTYPVGQARPNPSIDFATTGANHTWNFSTLRADTHFTSEWKGIGSVPQYSFSCGNWQFWQSLLLKIADSAPTPLGTIRDMYAFLSKTNTHLRIEGVGVTLNGIPLTFCYSDPDEVYVLPLTYGRRDSTTFRLRMEFQPPNQPGTVVIVQRGYRIHEVDGYGQVQIPIGTYDCLRLKRKVYQRDSVYFNGFPVQSRDTTYYELEWLGQGKGIPLVRAAGNWMMGNFVAASVVFQDSIMRSSLREGERDLVLGPNPTSGVLFLPKEGERYAVYDLTGRLWQEGAWPPDGRLVLSSAMPNGVYFLRLRRSAGESFHRFILAR